MTTGARNLLEQIASTPDHELLAQLPLLHRSLLLPLLSLASSAYKLSLATRCLFYQLGLFRKHRLPVPVISVGNLTWGGNGKTPMVDFLSLFFAETAIPPLILTRGYAGGDEAKMLQRHLFQSSARIGIGANRSATAASFFERHGYIDLNKTTSSERISASDKFGSNSTEKIGIVILDDGMQHWSLLREVDIVMVNGMMPWGNSHLIPRGPLREPLHALERADIAVIHHADLVSDKQLKAIESMIWKVKEILPVFFSRLAPLYFFEVKDPHSRLPLRMVHNMVVICISAIGFPNAFIQVIEKIGPLYVDRLDFSDHHFIQANDMKVIKDKLRKLQVGFDTKPVVVVTEKDYDRDPAVLKELDDFAMVLVLCSSLQIMSLHGRKEEDFKQLLIELLKKKSAR